MRDVINAIRRGLGRLRAQSPLRRELVIFGAALLFAVLVLPSLIWMAGQVFLGDYIRSPTGAPVGGPLAGAIWREQARWPTRWRARVPAGRSG